MSWAHRVGDFNGDGKLISLTVIRGPPSRVNDYEKVVDASLCALLHPKDRLPIDAVGVQNNRSALWLDRRLLASAASSCELDILPGGDNGPMIVLYLDGGIVVVVLEGFATRGATRCAGAAGHGAGWLDGFVDGLLDGFVAGFLWL